MGFTNNVTVQLGHIVATGAAPGTGVSYATVSDGRLQRGFARPYDERAPPSMRWKVYDFQMRSRPARGRWHHCARGDQLSSPHAISKVTTPDGETIWGVDYSKFTPLLLEETKRLRKRVTELETVDWQR